MEVELASKQNIKAQRATHKTCPKSFQPHQGAKYTPIPVPTLYIAKFWTTLKFLDFNKNPSLETPTPDIIWA